MTGSTPLGFPYPDATDRVADGFDAIHDLALAVDNYFAAQYALLSSSLAPLGSIVMWATATAPYGWLLCDGATFSAGTYPGLNALLGGTTTPDMRGRFPLGVAAGAGTGSALLGAGGAIDHTHTAPAHAHTTAAHAHSVNAGITGPPNNTNSSQSGSGTTAATGGHIHTFGANSTDTEAAAATSAAGNTATTAGNPPFLALNFIIKAI